MFRTLFLLKVIIFSGVVMASSLLLPSASSLAGLWLVENGSKKCEFQLESEAVDAANGYKLTTAAHCAGQLLTPVPTAWRPAPDGIAFLDNEGATIIFFARHDDVYLREVTGKGKFTLRRR